MISMPLIIQAEEEYACRRRRCYSCFFHLIPWIYLSILFSLSFWFSFQSRRCPCLNVCVHFFSFFLSTSSSSSSLWIPQSKPISFDLIVSFDGSLICCCCCWCGRRLFFCVVSWRFIPRKLWLIIYIADCERERERKREWTERNGMSSGWVNMKIRNNNLHNYVNLILSIHSFFFFRISWSLLCAAGARERFSPSARSLYLHIWLRLHHQHYYDERYKKSNHAIWFLYTWFQQYVQQSVCILSCLRHAHGQLIINIDHVQQKQKEFEKRQIETEKRNAREMTTTNGMEQQKPTKMHQQLEMHSPMNCVIYNV